MTVENPIQQVFKDPIEFSMFIEEKAKENDQTCLETLIEFLEDKEIEIEKIKNHLSQSLQDKIRQDFVDLGMIRANTTLNEFFE